MLNQGLVYAPLRWGGTYTLTANESALPKSGQGLILQLDQTAFYEVYGMEPGYDGEISTVANIGGGSHDFIDENGAALTSAHRFRIGETIRASRGQIVSFIYRAAHQRWFALAAGNNT